MGRKGGATGGALGTTPTGGGALGATPTGGGALGATPTGSIYGGGLSRSASAMTG